MKRKLLSLALVFGVLLAVSSAACADTLVSGLTLTKTSVPGVLYSKDISADEGITFKAVSADTGVELAINEAKFWAVNTAGSLTGANKTNSTLSETSKDLGNGINAIINRESGKLKFSGRPNATGSTTVYIGTSKTSADSTNASDWTWKTVKVTVNSRSKPSISLSSEGKATMSTDVSGSTVTMYLGKRGSFDVKVDDDATNFEGLYIVSVDSEMSAFLSGDMKVSFDPYAKSVDIGQSQRFSGTPKSIGTGSYTINITAYSNAASVDRTTTGLPSLSTTKTYTVKISDDAPIIYWSSDVAADQTRISGAEYVLTDVGYDTTNRCIYVGRNVRKSFDNTTPLNPAYDPFVFWYYGASEDAALTGTITPSGSGLSLVKSDDKVWSGDLAHAKMIYVLSGDAAKSGDYTLTVKATNALYTGSKAPSKTFKFAIRDIPSFTTTSIPAITWSEDYSASIAISNLPDAVIISYDSGVTNFTNVKDNYISSDVSFDQIVFGGAGTGTTGSVPRISFDETGKASYNIKGVWNNWSADLGVALSKDETTTTRKFRLFARKGSGDFAVYVSKDYTLTFNPPSAPAIEQSATQAASNIHNKAETQGSDSATSIVYTEESKDHVFVASADGPGFITWTVTGLPDGITIDTASTDNAGTTSQDSKTSALYLTVDPRVITTTAGAKLTITAKSDIKGSATITPTIKITADGVSISRDISARVPSGDHKVGDYSDETVDLTLFAGPGPLAWTTDNLPAGLTLTVSKDDTRYATLSTKEGKGLTASSTFKKSGTTYVPDSKYKITVKNTNVTSYTDTVSADLAVYAVPTISTSSLSGLTVDKEYKAALKFTNYPQSIDVVFEDNYDLEPVSAYSEYTDSGKWKVEDGDNTKYLYYDSSDQTIKGQLDRIPQGDDKNGKTANVFKVTVKAINKANEDYSDDENETAGARKSFYVTVKGVAPKFGSTGALSFSETTTTANLDLAAGTPPVSFDAYIAAKDYNKLFGTEETGNLPLSSVGLSYSVNDDDDGIVIESNAYGTYAFKNLPITVAAGNREKSPVTKSIKINVDGEDPSWTGEDEEISAATTKLYSGTWTATSTQPYEIKISPASGTAKNGLTPTLSGTTVSVSGTPTADKDTKTPITMTITNTSTKQKAVRKVTILGKYPPTVTSTADKLKKEVLVGKKVSLKPSAKGSKTITWTMENPSDELPSGVTFTASNGSLSGTANEVTVDENGKYEARKYTLQATNGVDTTNDNTRQVVATIGVKGAKPKLTTKNVTIKIGDSERDDIELTTNPAIGGDNVYMTLTADKLPNGITFTNPDASSALKSASGALTINDDSLTSTKGDTTTITLDNAGSTATGKVKFVINDAKPVISDFTISDMQASASSKAQQTVNLSLSAGYTSTNTKIKWAVQKAPSKAQAKIKGSGNSAVLTLTVAKGLKNVVDGSDTTINDSITVIATNTKTKEISDPVTVEFNIDPVATETTALPEEEESAKVEEVTANVTLPDAEHKKSKGEGEVKLGAMRTLAGLTAGEQTIINEEGYIVAAVLPEVTVTEDGQYDINVELAETVKEGAELKYFAFPRNAPSSTDDEICDFYEAETGDEITAVPASRKITVSPWFNAEVTYAPVIAVKADTGEAGAKTVDEIAEEVAAETESEDAQAE